MVAHDNDRRRDGRAARAGADQLIGPVAARTTNLPRRRAEVHRSRNQVEAEPKVLKASSPQGRGRAEDALSERRRRLANKRRRSAVRLVQPRRLRPTLERSRVEQRRHNVASFGRSGSTWTRARERTRSWSARRAASWSSRWTARLTTRSSP